MKIGVAGFGKMGKDIFTLFFDSLTQTEFVVLECIGTEEHAASVKKSLDKQLRRKKLTQEQYDEKCASVRFTQDPADFAGCDLVIEAITEQRDAKNGLFSEVAKHVSDDCLLLTNTSSLNIASVFEGVPHIERCFGMHFFYPVKLSEFVELNVLPDTSDEAFRKAAALLTEVGRKYITFAGDYHMYLNQILSCAVSHAVYLRDLLGVSTKELCKAMEELFPIAGPFEMLDSVGLGLMAENQMNFKLPRHQELLRFGTDKMAQWLEEGCGRGPNCFLSFIEPKETASNGDCSKAVLYMSAFLLNEAVNAMTECNTPQLQEACAAALGLSMPLKALYQRFDIHTIFDALDDLKARSGYACYDHQGADVWERFLLPTA
ncbi:MAG: 3-hydroxyacyl-CoA dehydrogenase family protein [Oscillospiraceae bacterium]|nr:3-hydroxyacyl-CoA dehydrogenase family protein [Oscillospiraceae bacterium]